VTFGPDDGDVGPDLCDLYSLLLEQAMDAEPNTGEVVREICDAMGNRLDQLEALLDDGSRPSALH
jgi:hypothetical protein